MNKKSRTDNIFQRRPAFPFWFDPSTVVMWPSPEIEDLTPTTWGPLFVWLGFLWANTLWTKPKTLHSPKKQSRNIARLRTVTFKQKENETKTWVNMNQYYPVSSPNLDVYHLEKRPKLLLGKCRIMHGTQLWRIKAMDSIWRMRVRPHLGLKGKQPTWLNWFLERVQNNKARSEQFHSHTWYLWVKISPL